MTNINYLCSNTHTLLPTKHPLCYSYYKQIGLNYFSKNRLNKSPNKYQFAKIGLLGDLCNVLIMQETFELMGIIFLLLILLGAVIFVPVYFLNRASCMKKYESYSPQHSMLGGCKVMWNDKLTPIDIIREIN